MSDSRTLERLVPDELQAGEVLGTETLALHVARYEFAARHVLPGRLLDIACGVGYGTRLLKDRCPELSHAVGVDLEPAAVDYARRRYAVDGIEYRTGDAHEFRDEQRFETIVSLETIEHLPDPERFLDNALEHVVAPGGRMICSVPVTPSVDANPHHLHDFTEASFRRMFRRRGLRELACLRQIQPFRLSSVVGNSEGRARDVRRNLPAYYWAHPMSFVSRVLSTLRYGLQNRYLTIAWAVPD